MIGIFFDPIRYPEEASALSAFADDPQPCVFGIDLSAPAQGLAALIAARREGKTTAILPLLAEPYEATLSTILQTIAGTESHEDRAAQLAALSSGQLLVNGKQPHELAGYAQAHLDAAALALRLADVVLVQAFGERDRWMRALGRPLRRYAVLPPVPARGDGLRLDETAVTIYAPSTPRAALAIYESLLAARRIETAVVAAENAADALQTRVVIAPEWRWLRARSLAGRGYHVVAPNAMRVDECDERIFGYAPPDLRGMLGAVDAALTASGGRERVTTDPQALAAALARDAATIAEGPAVSIVIRTFDRPELLRRAIESVARQTYRNVEIVVVNNGGNDVSDVVAAAAGGRPFRYECLAECKHISAASNAGARAATGAYVGYLDDDDLLYADHCARAVAAIERTQADVVFTTCLAEYAQMHGDEKRVIGYQIYLDRDFHPDDIFVANLSPIHTIVHRRDLFDRFGYFDEELPVTDDWELWLRASVRGARFVRVDRVTCEYSWRYDPLRGNMTIEHQWDFVRAYRTIAERYAGSVSGRTSILTAQANMLADQERRAQDAADPSKRAGVVIGAMSNAVVPVAPAPENAGSRT
ncbi:MAG: glycosyltransferase [Candidatus Eremiobacteraeota bacterium]|nr:glycosyltransferase [Candidatus Eremiobacteraeota bacterium]